MPRSRGIRFAMLLKIVGVPLDYRVFLIPQVVSPFARSTACGPFGMRELAGFGKAKLNESHLWKTVTRTGFLVLLPAFCDLA